MLTLEILSKNPQLNSFLVGKQFTFASGETAKVTMRLMQPDKNIRYIPDVAATITIDLKKSDGTLLTKTCAFTFADDRSIIEFDLSAVETVDVIGQNLIVKVQEGANVQLAVLQYGLSKVITDGSNC
jgi:hypothetical protein